MSGDILDTIDGALADYATSPDAMRWTPEPPRPDVDIDAATAAAAAAQRAFADLGVAAKRLARIFAEMDPLTRSALCLSHDVPDIWAERERAERRAADPRAHALAAKASRGTGPAQTHPGRAAYGRTR